MKSIAAARRVKVSADGHGVVSHAGMGMNVIDEFIRETLVIEVDRSIDTDGVVDVLDGLALTHGAPDYGVSTTVRVRGPRRR